MAKQRKANFELLRIVLMTMILFWHLIAHGILHLKSNPDFAVTQPSLLHLLIYPLRCYAVNGFILLSGYFGIRVTRERFLSFSTQMLFYTMLSFGIYLMLPEGQTALEELSWRSIKCIFPSTDADCWFASTYLLIMLLSPVLNAGAEHISKSKFAWMHILLIGVFLSGWHYYTSSIPETNIFLMTIYLLGRYIRLHPVKFMEKHCVWIWLGSIAFLSGHTAYLYQTGQLTCELFVRESLYSNPFNVIAAMAFFYMFKRIDIGSSSVINWFASGIFAAYLITDGYIKLSWNESMVSIFGTNVIVLLLVAIVAVLVFSSFEHLRKACMRPADKWLLNIVNKLLSKI